MDCKRVTSNWAKDFLNKNTEAILVDIRDKDCYETDHVQSAVHLSQETLSDFLKQTRMETPILVMCYHGNSSQMIAQFLTEQGFQEVYSVDGGYEGWQAK